MSYYIAVWLRTVIKAIYRILRWKSIVHFVFSLLVA